jgi:hypothetical protein
MAAKTEVKVFYSINFIIHIDKWKDFIEVTRDRGDVIINITFDQWELC